MLLLDEIIGPLPVGEAARKFSDLLRQVAAPGRVGEVWDTKSRVPVGWVSGPDDPPLSVALARGLVRAA